MDEFVVHEQLVCFVSAMIDGHCDYCRAIHLACDK